MPVGLGGLRGGRESEIGGFRKFGEKGFQRKGNYDKHECLHYA